MKQFLSAMAILITLFSITSCSKSNGSNSGSGSPITTDADAKAAFIKINALYNSMLKSLLTKKAQAYTNYVLVDTAGQKITVNGQYTSSSYSGSSGSTSSATLSVAITFQQFKYDDLYLDGKLSFFDWYSSRTDCGSAGCATATHKEISYATTDTTAVAAVAIKFTSNGKPFSDNINLTAEKEYSTFSIRMRNASGTKFNLSY